MTTLVVQAHPVEDSYSGALLEAVVHDRTDVRIRRLGQGDVLTDECFAGVDGFLAVYPTWWGSPPAMFLAALESTIGPWIDGGRPANTSPLRAVTALTIITSHGSSKFINALQGEPGLQLWKRTVLPLCAPNATFEWQSLYKLDRASTADRTRFLAQLN